MEPEPNEKCWDSMNKALEDLKRNKPNDRSEEDRRYAVTITEMEKAIAYFYYHVYGVE